MMKIEKVFIIFFFCDRSSVRLDLDHQQSKSPLERKIIDNHKYHILKKFLNLER